ALVFFGWLDAATRRELREWITLRWGRFSRDDKTFFALYLLLSGNSQCAEFGIGIVGGNVLKRRNGPRIAGFAQGDNGGAAQGRFQALELKNVAVYHGVAPDEDSVYRLIGKLNSIRRWTVKITTLLQAFPLEAQCLKR